ncbi:hypothetical protein [Cellulomonas sp. S1-8]|uniref:hypothetical protein n=1 Tax=Cellulomonas sp. S1-8 TaxID=2904790 RepID=UPI002243D5E5|nr:hypothetical protein [Cellulomonas sp. S1-8]UZN01744.1 hypothetical protein OKX07_11590 [Cellulomonas sp. S1-8]
MPARRPPRPAATRTSALLRTAGGVGAVVALTGCVTGTPVDPPPVATSTAAQRPAGDRATASTTDGTYTGTGSYETPGGPQRIDVTVVLADGVVEALRVDPAATNTTSLRFQERFASAVVDRAVGRPLQDVEVDRLAGSSSTGAGFMEALDQVVRDAALA